jgi:SAM-dependent methyltransferase
MRDRPDRYRVSIERLTVQDVAVFFQEALAELPQLVSDLSRGGRVVDIHCGGGRWLIAMARRFPAIELVGLEFQPDSLARARANVEAAGLAGRIEIRQGGADQVGSAGEFDLAYFQYALHQLDDPAGALRAAWAAMRAGGRLVVLDWALPSSLDEFRTRQGQLVAGVQLVPGHRPGDTRTVRRLVRRGGTPGSHGDRPAVRRVGLRRRSPLGGFDRPGPVEAPAASDHPTVIVPFMFGWILQWNG